MPHYIVIRPEIRTQKVEIEAADKEEARRKASYGHGDEYDDARFREYAGSLETWEVGEEGDV